MPVSLASPASPVTRVVANNFAYAALHADGSVTPWGAVSKGGSADAALQTQSTQYTSGMAGAPLKVTTPSSAAEHVVSVTDRVLPHSPNSPIRQKKQW